MEYQTVITDENDGQEQTFSPCIQFETQEDQHNNEKRTKNKRILLIFILFILESRWSHQKDLDDFFIRIYQYHQKHGFFCIILSEIFGLVYVKRKIFF